MSKWDKDYIKLCKKNLHIYFEPIHFVPDKLNRPIVLSEYGGYGCLIQNHTYSTKILRKLYFYLQVS